MSFAPRFTISHPITAALTLIERARGFLEAAKLSEEWIRRMGERALVLEAHRTAHIEGTRLTLETGGGCSGTSVPCPARRPDRPPEPARRPTGACAEGPPRRARARRYRLADAILGPGKEL